MMTDKLRAAAKAALEELIASESNAWNVINDLEAALAKPEQEYICKCGLRVTQHQCKIDKEF
jgi:hypothetical protein